jgi:hypothetical protein
MGYYANAIEGYITLPKDKQDAALKSVVETLTTVSEGRGSFFSSIDNYSSAEWIGEVLNEEGFEFSQEDNGDLIIISFDAKWREQEHVLNALAEYATETSYMGFIGEDYALWKWTPNGIVEGKITW